MEKIVDVYPDLISNPQNPKAEHFQIIDTFGTLGRELKISPKAHMTVNKAGYSAKYFVPTVSVVIGIGNDNIAELTMTMDAWEAFKIFKCPVNITTTKEFKEKFL